MEIKGVELVPGMVLEYIAEFSGGFTPGDMIKVTKVDADAERIYYTNIYRAKQNCADDWIHASYVYEFQVTTKPIPENLNYKTKIQELEARKIEYLNKIEEIEDWISVLEQANKICEVA